MTRIESHDFPHCFATLNAAAEGEGGRCRTEEDEEVGQDEEIEKKASFHGFCLESVLVCFAYL